MNPIETYFSELGLIHSSGAGTRETSYYPPLAKLLDDLGKKLSPKVRCVSQLANTGAGSPDFGLYTKDQFQRSGDQEPRPGQMPARGAVELKGPGADLEALARSQQVRDYLNHYRLLLVGNLREFRLMDLDAQGIPHALETCTLASSPEGLWSLCAHPKRSAAQHGERFGEFLRRVMLHRSPLAAPKDLAWFLASYAREARARIESSALDALSTIRGTLEETLGIRFSGDKGEHFFRSTFMQTLFYGVFSAWVLWDRHTSRADREARFDWRLAADFLHVPLLRKLFYLMADPGPLRRLGLTEVLDWAGAALNRVDRPAFFQAFDEGQAVQYFYEPFLEAFDPELRKELGVWYTPSEIVQYMVARVDRVLRDELGIAQGLAGEDVYILDPCCGTGAFLVEALKTIAHTLKDGGDALWASDLKKAALKRVIGFEILTAPFVVSHLQLGLVLSNLGAPIKDDETERVGVYLTNALTGWEPPSGPKARLPFREFEEERDAADAVKRERPILVVLGNPPYNAFAGVSPVEEQGLVDVYKEGLNKPVAQGGWGIKKFNLDDLYVRFFRLAERRIAEKTGKGIVCFVSNFSYLSDPSFVVMRQRFLNNFDRIFVDCLNGDSRETGKLTPEGEPDPSVFSTEYNRAGIRVGTAICLMARHKKRLKPPSVGFRDFWGATKCSDLIANIGMPQPRHEYKKVSPSIHTRLSFKPVEATDQYLNWVKIDELCQVPPFNGPIERRGNSLIVIESYREQLYLVKLYLDPALSDEEISEKSPLFMRSSGEFDAERTRKLLKGKVQFQEEMIVHYPYKPFDVRLCYLDARIQPLFSRPSPELLATANIINNSFLISRDTADKAVEGPPFLFSKYPCDYDCISGHARHFPVFYNEKKFTAKLPKNKSKLLKQEWVNAKITIRANLSKHARLYLGSLGIDSPDENLTAANCIWLHSLAIGYSPIYLSDNADGIKNNWPRIPLPATKEALLSSASLGRRLTVLLDPESIVSNLNTGTRSPELQLLALVSRDGGGQLDPEAGDLALTAGWGYANKVGAIMPGAGRAVERPCTPDELAALEQGAGELGLTPEQALDLLGHTTLDVYLNDRAFWRNVPKNVWTYTIGGYQVLKKWLSYRERPLLGRDLKPEEARYVSEVARRIAAILLLGPALDTNYREVKANTYPRPGASPDNP